MKTRMMIVKVGFYDFAMTPEDALALVAIADRAVPVKQKDWQGPWLRDQKADGDAREIVTECRMGTVMEPEPDEPFAEPEKPAPLAIGHTPKLAAPEDEILF